MAVHWQLRAERKHIQDTHSSMSIATYLHIRSNRICSWRSRQDGTLVTSEEGHWYLSLFQVWIQRKSMDPSLAMRACIHILPRCPVVDCYEHSSLLLEDKHLANAASTG